MNYANYDNLLALMPQLAAKVGTSIIPWQANTLYSQGQILLYNNTLYKVDIAFTSSSSFDDTNLTSISGSSSSSSFEDWQASTSYTSGQKIVYEGQIYEVTTDFTSSSTFDDTNLTEYIPNELTAQDLQDIANAFNPSGSGSGGGLIVDTLWSTNTFVQVNDVLNLSSSIDNYDFLLLMITEPNQTYTSYLSTNIIPVTQDLNYGGVSYYESANDYYCVSVTFSSRTQVEIGWLGGKTTGWVGFGKILGLKFSSGSSETMDYSTNEQCVGTWIDGKPLYQKTIQCGTIPNNASSDVIIYNEQDDFEMAMLIEDASYIIIPYISGSHTAYTYNAVNIMYDFDTKTYNSVYVNVDEGELQINVKCSSEFIGCNLITTVRYTKTTD